MSNYRWTTRRTVNGSPGRTVGWRTGGPLYLEHPEVADLFAFLLEKDEARRAIELDEDLRDIIMRPVDTDAIRAEINALVEDRRELDQRLDELGELKVTRDWLRVNFELSLARHD